MANSNLKSIEYNGNQTFPANRARDHWFILAKSGGLSIEMGDGGGTIDLDEGGYYSPDPAPRSKISITSGGTYVIVTNEV